MLSRRTSALRLRRVVPRVVRDQARHQDAGSCPPVQVRAGLPGVPIMKEARVAALV